MSLFLATPPFGGLSVSDVDSPAAAPMSNWCHQEMNSMIIRRLFAAMALVPAFFAFTAAAQTTTQTPDREVERIVRIVDSLYRGASSRARIEMVIVTPRWQRQLQLSVSTRGDSDTFIRINDPAKERGTGTLRHGEEIWNYLPRAGEVVRIPPSLLMNAWMGSDFTNDDLLKQYTFFRDHVCVRATDGQSKEGAELHIRCDPKPAALVLWKYVLLVADAASGLPLRQEFYDRADKPIRSLTYSNVANMNGRSLPTVLRMAPAALPNQYTEIRYKSLQFDVKLSDDVFSRRYLQGSED